MSYGLSPYLLDEKAALIFGCKDEQLLAEVLATRAQSLAKLDEQFDVEEDELITHADALREIFRGTPTRDDCGGIYGWAYSEYCDALGEFLDNSAFMPCRWEWYVHLDKLLEPSGVPLRFAKLTSASPIPIPPADDWPIIGHWTHDEIVASTDPLARLLATGVTDTEAAAALQFVHDKWIVPAAARPGSIIVGFHG